MITKGVIIKTKEIGNIIEIWLENDEQKELALHELQFFVQNPYHPKYNQVGWQKETKLPIIQHYPHTLILKSILKDAGILTYVVIILCCIIYGLMLILGNDEVMSWLAYPDNPWQREQVWRFITPIFLHFSPEHILFNLALWWYLAGKIELHLGRYKLIILTIISALISNFVQGIFSANLFGGLSGVVYALIGYVWLFGEKNPNQPLVLPRAMVFLVFIGFFLNYFDFLSPIANAAHVSGLIVGILFAILDVFYKKTQVIK